ncbi:MAG: hypothetical protein JWP44_2619 [Mucilaginibacter sp.]|nr:hypothetical protein [Mucilaginibacter sp.]
MNPKFRYVYLLGGVLGLALLIYQIVDNFPDFNPGMVLLITVPDMVFFFLAYKTYPEEEEIKQKVKSY